MANRSDILNRLREYEVPPPPAVFHNLMNRLQADRAEEAQWLGAWQGLQELEIQPPSFLSVAITKAIVEKPLLAALQDMAITPPAGAFNRILRQIAAESKTQAPPTPIRKLFYRFRAIAAVLLLVIAGWGIYRFADHPPAAPSAKTAPQTAARQSSSNDTVQQQPATPYKPDMARYEVYDNVKTQNYFKNNRFTVEGTGMSLVEHDFMVTFASYRYDELPSFLAGDEEESSEMKIRLDQYSYFTISKEMMKSLKRMYQRKGKGTPTRKARKEKAKLEQWKKADESHFDYRRFHNPLDPIDLAEFIFK